MERESFCTQELMKTLGKNVLARVLLHMVEASLPLNFSRYFSGGYILSQKVYNPCLIFQNLEHFHFIYHSLIAGLPP
ncbi:hypothetical protein ES703_89114 [subsurface metagenome]